jgi:hypothetical protein
MPVRAALAATRAGMARLDLAVRQATLATAGLIPQAVLAVAGGVVVQMV